MPPRADSAIDPPGVIRNSRASFDGDTAPMRPARSGHAEHVRGDEPRALDRSQDAGDDDVAAALERRRVRLLEHDVADAEQLRHDRDAESEAGREHRRAHRPRDQRPPGDPQHHASTTVPRFIVSRRVARAASTGIVRDDHDRRAVGVHAIEEIGDLLARVLVELAGRLVRQQQRRPVRQRARDRHALHLAAGELRRPMVRARSVEADVVEQLARALPAFCGGRPDLGLRQLDVLPGVEHRQQEEPLKHEADPRQADAAPLGLAQPRRRRGLRTAAIRSSGASTHPSRCSSVDLPQPDGPVIAT